MDHKYYMDLRSATMTSFKSSCTPPSVSTGTGIRRKPIFTYQSPAAHISTLYLDKRPSRGISTSSVTSPSASSASLAPNTTSPSTIAADQTPKLTFATDRASSSSLPSYKHPRMNALLPLYHPFGPLALSLPDLDPTSFGLPAAHVIARLGIFDDADAALHPRSSSRTRRPAVKLRDATEDTPHASVPAGASPSLVDVTPVLESEPLVRDKPSPRKRRNGGAGNKRRRRDVDDGDATYPAKRIRNPRSSALASSVPIAGSNTPTPEEINTPSLQRAEGMRKAGLLDGDRRGCVDNLRGGIRRQVRLLYHLHRSHLRLVLLLGIRVGIWKSTNPSLHQRLYRRNRMVRMRLGLLLPSSLAPHPVLGRGVQRSLSKQRKARAWCTTNLCTDSGIYCIT